MKPSVGRTVHYVSYGTPKGEYTSQCRAAIITEVKIVTETESSVSLCVLNPEGLFFNKDSAYSDNHTGGTWHWSEREKE